MRRVLSRLVRAAARGMERVTGLPLTGRTARAVALSRWDGPVAEVRKDGNR